MRQRRAPDDVRTYSAKTWLGAALAGQNRFAEAEPLLLEGYRGMKERESSIPAQGRFRVREALDRIIALYLAWEKPEEAAKWQALVEPQPPAPE